MAESSGDLSLGYMMGSQDAGGGNNGGGMGGFGGGWGDLAALLIIAGLFGWGGRGGGFGGFGGGGSGGEGGGGYVTRADLASSFSFNGLENAVRGIQQGICDATFSLNNSIMSGFHGVDNAICNLGFHTQQGFNTLGYAVKDCCCETQRLIERGFCDVGYGMATNTANIIQAGHNDTDRVIAKLDMMENARMLEKIDALRTENQTLRFQASQANQNNYIAATIDAATAEVLRRTGHSCPTAAYLVQPPTPINFPTNGCGTVQFGGYSGGGYCGCGCGCGA